MAASTGGISATGLGPDKLGELFSKLYPVRAKWYNLGLGLGISCNDLDAIKKDCKEDTGECLKEVLKLWLKSQHPGIADLIKSLSEPIVGESQLAKELLTWSPSIDTIPSPPNCSSIQSEEPKDLLAKSSPLLSDSMTQTDVVSTLSPDARPYARNVKVEDFKFLIRQDLKKLKEEFITLQFNIRESLTVKVSPEKITAHVLADYANVHESSESERSVSLFNDRDKERLHSPTSVNEIFEVLQKYWSFVKCEMLFSIAKHCGDESDHVKVTEYQGHLKKFFENRKLSEIPEELLSSNTVDELHEKLLIKLDRDDPCWKDIEELEFKICEILGIMPSALVIVGFRQGCVELRFNIPRHIAPIIFHKDLSSAQQEKLRALFVLTLSCGGFHATIAEEKHTEDIHKDISCPPDHHNTALNQPQEIPCTHEIASISFPPSPNTEHGQFSCGQVSNLSVDDPPVKDAPISGPPNNDSSTSESASKFLNTPSTKESERKRSSLELSAQESNTESSVEEACFDYTRSDGTYVAPHTRSTPLRGSFIASSSTGSSAGTVQVRGYIRSDGTYVAPHTRATPSRGSRSSSMASGVSNVTGVTSRDTVPVSGYMRADGTKVSGYTRAMPSPRTSQASSVTMKSVSSTLTTESPTKFYVDNAFNRKVGRVGKPIGTCIISNAAKGEKPQRVYKDNAANRRLDRVGQPIPPRKRNKIHEALEQNTVEKLRAIVRLLMSSQAIVQRDQSDYEEQVYALNMLEQQEVEEKWEAMDVDPSTDIARLSAYHVQGKIIARSELQLENKIGQGGFGVVYAGLWHETPIAFKKLHYQRMSKKHQESFTTEVAVLAALNHPNVVRMFGVVVETDNIGIVMEYCTNRSLFHAIFIICTIFSEEKKIEIVTQVASAVEYLHNHDPKIVHCDIKSENILLDKDNNAKLSDFGLSTIKNATESSQSNVGVIAPGKGTPRYSAPEVLRGEILKTDKLFPTDIYSLSIVVVEVVLEEEAYEGLSVRQLEANVGTGDLRPTLPDTLPKQVVDLLQNSWHSDPSERPTATEFHARWREISSFTS